MVVVFHGGSGAQNLVCFLLVSDWLTLPAVICFFMASGSAGAFVLLSDERRREKTKCMAALAFMYVTLYLSHLGAASVFVEKVLNLDTRSFRAERSHILTVPALDWTFEDIKGLENTGTCDIRMRQLFRVDWTVFQYLVALCKTYDADNEQAIDFKRVVGVALMHLGRQISYHDAGANVSPSTAHRYVKRFVNSLSSAQVLRMFIKFPETYPANWKRGFTVGEVFLIL